MGGQKQPFRHYSKVLAKHGWNIVQGLNGGYVVLRVEKAIEIPYEYMRHAQLPAQSGGTPGSIDFTQIKDSSSNQPLKPTNDYSHIQLFEGLNFPYARRFIRIPKGRGQYGLEDNISSVSRTGVFGWEFEGHESPREYPTEKSMVIVPKKMEIEVAYANPTNIAPELTSRFIINLMKVLPLNPENSIHFEILKLVFAGKVPTIWYDPNINVVEQQDFKGTFGGINPIQWDGVEAWYQSPTEKVKDDEGRLSPKIIQIYPTITANKGGGA